MSIISIDGVSWSQRLEFCFKTSLPSSAFHSAYRQKMIAINDKNDSEKPWRVGIGTHNLLIQGYALKTALPPWIPQ